jgi:hypothetical protein
VLTEYEAMQEKYGFTVIDATREIHDQQCEVRGTIAKRIHLPDFHA